MSEERGVKRREKQPKGENIMDKYMDTMINSFAMGMRGLGLGMCCGLYTLVGIHTYAFFKILIKLIIKRVGVKFGMVWIAIALSLLYNTCYNHFLAMITKPGSPWDLKRTEKLRNECKKRKNRKEIEDEDDDKFEGLTSNVKKVVRYRSKTVD
jgi:hypothetical protein